MKTNDWIHDIEDELPELLDGDAALLLDVIGTQALAALWDKLSGVNLYVSTRPQLEAKKRYIQKHWDNNTKDLALRLGVTDRFVQKALREKKRPTKSLFEDLD